MLQVDASKQHVILRTPSSVEKFVRASLIGNSSIYLFQWLPALTF